MLPPSQPLYNYHTTCGCCYSKCSSCERRYNCLPYVVKLLESIKNKPDDGQEDSNNAVDEKLVYISSALDEINSCLKSMKTNDAVMMEKIDSIGMNVNRLMEYVPVDDNIIPELKAEMVDYLDTDFVSYSTNKSISSNNNNGRVNIVFSSAANMDKPVFILDGDKKYSLLSNGNPVIDNKIVVNKRYLCEFVDECVFIQIEEQKSGITEYNNKVSNEPDLVYEEKKGLFGKSKFVKAKK